MTLFPGRLVRPEPGARLTVRSASVELEGLCPGPLHSAVRLPLHVVRTVAPLSAVGIRLPFTSQVVTFDSPFHTDKRGKAPEVSSTLPTLRQRHPQRFDILRKVLISENLLQHVCSHFQPSVVGFQTIRQVPPVVTGLDVSRLGAIVSVS